MKGRARGHTARTEIINYAHRERGRPPRPDIPHQSLSLAHAAGNFDPVVQRGKKERRKERKQKKRRKRGRKGGNERERERGEKRKHGARLAGKLYPLFFFRRTAAVPAGRKTRANLTGNFRHEYRVDARPVAARAPKRYKVLLVNFQNRPDFRCRIADVYRARTDNGRRRCTTKD